MKILIHQKLEIFDEFSKFYLEPTIFLSGIFLNPFARDIFA